MLGPAVMLVGFRREKHEVIETMPPEVAMLAEIEIEFGALRKPEFDVLFLELHRPVLNDLVLC